MKKTNENKHRLNVIGMTVLIILFALSLYIVEWSSIGSMAVGLYNNGYGTFDMKSYSPDIVRKVLSEMEPMGFDVYRKYFAADFFFVLTFGTLQTVLLSMAYRWVKNKKILYALCTVPVLRGAFDTVENILLLNALNQFPEINERAVNISAASTELKLLMIKIWAVIFIIGIVWGVIIRHKK